MWPLHSEDRGASRDVDYKRDKERGSDSPEYHYYAADARPARPSPERPDIGRMTPLPAPFSTPLPAPHPAHLPGLAQTAGTSGTHYRAYKVRSPAPLPQWAALWCGFMTVVLVPVDENVARVRGIPGPVFVGR